MPGEQTTDGYLFDLYRRYIGEPEDRTDVYLGFGLFLGGIGFAVIALVLFLWSTTLSGQTEYYRWVEPAYALAMLSLPVVMLGIVVLLPSERRVVMTSFAGAGIAVLAVGGFLYAFPHDWHYYGEDYTVEVIATYAIGVAAITASTGASLIAHYLDMARQADVVAVEEEDESNDVTDEEVRADIDEAMEDVEMSWGGVTKTEHKRLDFSSDEFDDVSVDTSAGTTTTRSSGVDAQVAGLKGLKGGETSTETSSSTVDDQTAKLNELREQQRAEELAEADPGPVESLLERIRALLGRS